MAQRRPTREEKKADTRARLLQAAARVFARRGYHGASVEEVADEAGFSTGALYSNFAGKEDLFLALFEEHVAQQVRRYREIFARGRTLDEQARGGADEWMAYLSKEPEYFPLFIEFWSYAVRDPELRPKFAARFGAFREAIADMIESGASELGIALAPGVAEQIATVVNALGNGMALEKLADPDSVPDELFGLGLAVLFEALAAGARGGEFGEAARVSERAEGA